MAVNKQRLGFSIFLLPSQARVEQALNTESLPAIRLKAAGNGLGLAIAKKIVEDHSGKIYLDSRIEKGTLITISLPFAIPGT